MQNDLNNYSSSTADWRKTLRQNTQKTYIVIGLFFVIYAGIGLLVDMFMSSATYPRATMPQLFDALITLQIFPLATVSMCVIAAVSLFVSYAMYDKLMLLGTDYHEITPETARNTAERQLYNVVEEMKIAAGLHYMPKVFIINADYMNAFASGYSEKSAMVAITRGLMEKLNRDELQAVMAHEISHIRHLDIKLTLTASLLANLTIMVLDMFFYNAMFSSRSNDSDNRSRNSLATIIIILRYLLPIVNVILLLYLSRTRELMADAGCVELMRANQPLATALLKINDDHVQNRERYAADYQQTPHENTRREAYIYDPTQAGISGISSVSDLFSTHPSIEERLAALGFKGKKYID
jgi:heat shock protein HtpX